MTLSGLIVGCVTAKRSEQFAALEQEVWAEQASARALSQALAAHNPLAALTSNARAAPRYYEARGLRLSPSNVSSREAVARFTCDALRKAGLSRCDYQSTENVRLVSRETDCAEKLQEVPIPVLLAIAFASAPERRGAELDVRLSEPHAAGSLLVSLRHEPTGELVVEAREGPSLPSVGTPSATVTEDLSARFGIGPLEDDSSRWTASERDSAVRALSLLSERERLAIRGVPFTRRREASPGRPKEEAGEYLTEAESKTISRRIVMLDRAYLMDDFAFVGSVDAPERASTYVLLHEIGHAISLYAHYLRASEVSERIERFNDLVIRFNRLGRRTPEREISGMRQLQAGVEDIHASLERAKPAVERLIGTTPVLIAYSGIPDARQGPTEYARTSVLEAFAESFALYRADPDALRRFSPAVYAFFSTDQHVGDLPELPASPALP